MNDDEVGDSGFYAFESFGTQPREASKLDSYGSRHRNWAKIEMDKVRIYQNADSMKASGTRVFFLMMLTGLSMTILNLVSAWVIGWPTLSSNPLLAYLLSFAMLSGLSLIVYAIVYFTSLKHRIYKFVTNEQRMADLRQIYEHDLVERPESEIDRDSRLER